MANARHSLAPHYLRFARALSLVTGIAATIPACASEPASTEDAGHDASTYCTGCTYIRCESGLPPEVGPPLCPYECIIVHDSGGLTCGPLPPPELAV